jgi:CheY-like chemotaxis protein
VLENFSYAALKREQDTDLTFEQIPDARVLIVDDIEINLEVARSMMEVYGLQIDCVDNGREAAERIRRGAPAYDIVFMDQMMPELDGFETVRIIREEIGTRYARTIPIVALTANATTGNEEMFLNSGFHDFLAKPINHKELNQVLHRWVVDRQHQEQGQEQQE